MHEMSDFKEVWEFTERYPAPGLAVAHAKGTDVAEDVHVLFSLVRGVNPAAIVELGTRQGVTAKTLAYGAMTVGATFDTVDPDHGCRPYLRDLIHSHYCRFHCMTGEHAYEQHVTPIPDMLFIDTDPHTYDQTKMWLETWVANRVSDHGVIVFHDTVAARPEIQVADAVRSWLRYTKREDWRWVELQTTYGLGILWKP